jgi:hypothetical protein
VPELKTLWSKRRVAGCDGEIETYRQ